ncbi:MAG: hypothetical protein II007_12635 [Gammaproteobacteria bacterium]|nr:hypothetical protein [Gammaproteobacteria bacterium]
MNRLVFLLSAAVLCAVAIIYVTPQSASTDDGAITVENNPAVVAENQPQHQTATESSKSEPANATSAQADKPDAKFGSYMADLKSGISRGNFRGEILELSAERMSAHLAWLNGIMAIDDQQLLDAAEQGSPRAISLLFDYHDRAGNAEPTEYYGKRLLPLMPSNARLSLALRIQNALAASQRYDEAAVYLLYANMTGMSATSMSPVSDDDVEYWATDSIEALAAGYPDAGIEMFSVSNVIEEWRALDAQIRAESEALFGDSPPDFSEVITAASPGN